MASRYIVDLLAEHYGVSGEVSRLPGENENYLVTQSSGERLVLKIDRVAEDAVLLLESRAASAFHRAEPKLRVPVAVPNRSGEQVSRTTAGGAARVLEFVAGVAWGDCHDPGPATCRDFGRVLARMAGALATVQDPAARRTHRWDLTAASQHREKVALIEGGDRRRAVEQAFATYAAYATGLDALPRGLIHGDANDENVLLENGCVVGMLDFGDCLDNPLVCDLAIALAYVMQRASDPFGSAAEVVGGYHAERALAAEELEALFPLILGRLAVTVTMCAERRAIDPTRSSWFVSEKTSWDALFALAHLDPVDARHRLGAAADTAINTALEESGTAIDALIATRQQRINPALSLAYREPIQFVRGRGQYLIDHRGRPFLDLVNNVCHVGHCHPRVVEAGQRQMAQLNTNTRYLYEGLTAYAERLCATLPPELDTCFFVNSGSEANELALRLARAHTGRRDMLVVDSSYHGHTSALIDMSPYKFMGRGGTGRAEPWVHVVPVPDGYRGPHKGAGEETGTAYADAVQRVIADSKAEIAGFLCESLLSCGGQIVPPDGYMARAFEHVRAAGGVCIADEVQVGFARPGSHFWAFERQDVVPDMVVLGKPIGNGHPMAAVIARSEIARSFANGMEFFATFGGNPVSCAIGTAVLDVIEDEHLQEHALDAGTHFKNGLQGLMSRHPLIGDVRGTGLFLGVELVKDRDTLEPATAEADELINRMRQRGILLSTDGPYANVLKIKPPMVLTADDIDMVVRELGEVLREI